MENRPHKAEKASGNEHGVSVLKCGFYREGTG